MPVYVGPRRPAPRFPDLTQVARARDSLVKALGAAVDASGGDESCAHRAKLIIELHKACTALDLRLIPEPEGAAGRQRRNGAVVAVVVALLVFIAGALGFVAGDLSCRLDLNPASLEPPAAAPRRLA